MVEDLWWCRTVITPKAVATMLGYMASSLPEASGDLKNENLLAFGNMLQLGCMDGSSNETTIQKNSPKSTQNRSAMLYTWPSKPDLNSSENLWGELKTLYSMLNVGMPNISPIPHLTKDVNNSWADCRKLL